MSRSGSATGSSADPAAASVSQLTGPTVRDLTVSSGLRLEDAGEHELKGVPERWRLYRVGTA